MSVKIRLKRMGSKGRPYYRIVVMDSRSPRDGKTIDEVGVYHPIETDEKQLNLKEQKIRDWLSKGAIPTPTVRNLLNKKEIHIKQD